jgi:RNA polymerase sigma factor (sigma-70 family)
MLEALQVEAAWDFQSIPPSEHARLVRLCARLSGDHGAAEDLAQETLLEAWRQRHKLVDHHAYPQWLTTIARNICLRWRSRHAKEAACLAQHGPELHIAALHDQGADAFDIDIELDRQALAELLDRAMACLPPLTRRLLIERYINESPQAEIAARFGITEGAVEARLHRGKLALRRILTTELKQEAADHGVGVGSDAGWQATQIWCPFCGAHKLLGRLDRDAGDAQFRCPGCPEPTGGQISHTRLPAIIHGVRSPKAVLSRQINWLNQRYRQALVDWSVPCPAPTAGV